MAPQQSFYGSVPMDSQKEEKSSHFVRRALVTTGVVVVVSLALFTASSSMQDTSAAINAKSRSGYADDNLVMWKPDCKCRYDKCPKTADDDGKTRCGVKVHNCMGADYGPAIDKDGKSVRFNTKIDCSAEGTGDDKDKTSPCRAVCDVVLGRNQCDKFPCLNQGWCKDLKDGFKCFCKPGWTGDNCGQNIDECLLEGDKKVCDKHAVCTDTPGQYRCACPKGFYGQGYAPKDKVAVPSWMTKIYNDNKDADPKKWDYGCKDVNDCAENPCMNGGTCINAFGVENGWSCECLTGSRSKAVLFKGKKCESDVNECKDPELPHSCDKNADCVNMKGRAADGTGDGYTCVCKDNWKSEDPTGNDHHGVVERRHVTGDATGKKPDGTEYVAGCYDIDDCSKDNTLPCQNGGTCSEGLPGCWDDVAKKSVECYSCKCVVGWSGTNCEEDEDECNDSMAGGEEQKTKTPLAPCNNVPSATCVNTAGSYGCRCNLGWTGDGLVCVDANDCEFSPCSHGGTCVDCGTLCFSCNCVVGWRGTTCGTDWNECLMGIHRCHDDATCVNSPGSYACRCDAGFTGNGVGSSWLQTVKYKVHGVDKETKVQHGCVDIDDCANAQYEGTMKIPGWNKNWNQGPCQYGTCTDIGADAYHCECWDGWTDSNCDTNVNECDSETGSSQCHQFATCVNLPGEGNPAPKVVPNTGAKCNADKSPYSDAAKCTAANMGAFKGADAKCKEKDAEKCTKTDCCELPSSCRHADSPFKTNKQCRAAGMGKRKGKTAKCLDKDPKKCTKQECCEVPTLYSCKCNKGFEGDGYNCKDKQDCTQGACNKRGYCTDLGVDQHKCSCDKGWQDSDCSKNQNECTDFTHECGQNAVCVDTAGSYLCQCPVGFVGYHPVNPLSIPMGAKCVDINDCGGKDNMGKCANAKKCTDGGVNLYTCDCLPGWTDYDCNFDVNECLGAHNCWKGGVSTEKHHRNLGYKVTFKAARCVNTPGSYECKCPKGMIGRGLKTNKRESVYNKKDYFAKRANYKKGEAGQHNVEILPVGCVDYDDCRTVGDDNLWHTNDKNEKFNKFKCSEEHPERGKCVDTGANAFKCDCAKGWGCGAAVGCDTDCDECADKTHNCDAHATCTNTLAKIGGDGKVNEGFVCRCNWPDAAKGGMNEGSNIPGYYGSKAARGKSCSPCTECSHGFRAVGICKYTDRSCVDINECANEAWTELDGTKRVGNPCSADATCENTPGSYTCECNDGFFASTVKLDARRPVFDDVQSRGCEKCTVCQDGFHVVKPCTRLSDTVCERDVPAYVPATNAKGTTPFDANKNSGIVIIKTEADENLQCLTIAKDSWFPSRVDFGGIGQCGATSKKQWGEVKPQVLWSFTGLGDNTPKDGASGMSNWYLIRYKGPEGPCLFFGDEGRAIYPSLQHCMDSYPNGKCPWGESNKPYCGYQSGDARLSPRQGLLANLQAVWKVTTLKLSEDKFILQSAAKKKRDMEGKPLFDCLVFEKQGTATNPTRFNWGNGDRMCGVGNWGDTTLAMALMNNKQAVFILESYTKFEHSDYQLLKHRAWHNRRRAEVAKRK